MNLLTDPQGRAIFRASRTLTFAHRVRLLVAISVHLSLGAARAEPAPRFSDENWASMGGLQGADGAVHATLHDGSGNLYVGGNFTAIGNVKALGVAKWDGTNWTALGSAFSNGYAQALAFSGNVLYVGGWFEWTGGTGTAQVVQWDGTNWSAVGSGLPIDGSVWALAVSGNDVYVGGRFDTAGGVPAKNIAKWNGSTWSPLSGGITGWPGPNGIDPTQVDFLRVVGTDLYAAGNFSVAGGQPISGIARWNGSSWSALGSGLGGNIVRALAVSGSDLYVGGQFTTAGNLPSNGFAKWDGVAWYPLGDLPGGRVTSFATSADGDLYAGHLYAVGNAWQGGVSRWDDTTWTWNQVGPGFEYTVTSVAVVGTTVYAGGEFVYSPDVAASYMARWDGSRWSAPGAGHGLSGPVRAIAVSGNDVYVGGEFGWADGINVKGIAKWNGTRWSALGNGMDDYVEAIAVIGSNVYALAPLQYDGPNAYSTFRRFNGSNWSTFGSGRNAGSIVRSIVAVGNNLYVGGNFTSIGGQPIPYLARWNGSSWSGVGGGLNGEVTKLAAFGNDLYALGGFTTAGGNPARYIAKWNGSTWSSLGSPPFGGGSAIAASADGVYVSHIVIRRGTHTVSKWDGTNWSRLPITLGEGLVWPYESGIYSLAATGGDMYIGGSFVRNAEGNDTDFRNIARWDGISLSPLGTGTNDRVSAAVVSGNVLYTGGDFTLAGGKATAFAAKGIIPPRTGRFENLNFSTQTGFSFTFTDATIGQPYRIQWSSSLAPGTWSDLTGFTYTGPVLITDPPAASAGNRFFRAITP